jgi:hypothetical protein
LFWNCHPEAAGGAEPKAQTPEDAEGSEGSQVALHPKPELRILNYYFRKTSSGAMILSGVLE